MPFVQYVPENVAKLYIDMAIKHNDPATSDVERQMLYWRGAGIFEACNAMGLATGMMLADADMAAMKIHPDRDDMCGGLLQSPALAEEIEP